MLDAPGGMYNGPAIISFNYNELTQNKEGKQQEYYHNTLYHKIELNTSLPTKLSRSRICL
jgi:hypothetical protein